jgi:hypothetical protein
MAGLIGSLRVDLSADTAAFSSGMSKAQRQAATSSSRIQKSLSGIGVGIGRVASAAGALGIAFSAAAFATYAKQALDYAASLGELARQAGVTVEQYQVLERAAIANGSSMDAMAVGLKRLQKTLGDAQRGSETATAAFAAVGISKEQLGSFRQAGDAIRPMMQGLEGLGSESVKVSVGAKLMGKSFADLLPTLSGGAKAYDEMTAAAVESGLLTTEQADKADQANDSIDLLAKTLRTKLAIALTDNLPAISSVIDGLADLIDQAATAIRWLDSVKVGIANFNIKTKVGASGFLQTVGAVTGLMPVGSAVAGISQVAADGRSRLQRTATPPKIVRVAQRGLTGGGAAQDLASGGGGGGGGSGNAERLRKDALRDAYRAETDQRRAEIDLLRAKMDLVVEYEDRDELQREILGLERQQEHASNAMNVAMGDMTQSQADRLNATNDLTHALELQAIKQEGIDRATEDQREIEEARSDVKQAALESEADMAETAAERRAAELRILEHTFAREKAALELARTKGKTAQERNLAGEKLDALEAGYAGKVSGVMRGTMGPLEAYLASLPTTAAKANEALEAIAANGLQSITDGLAEAMMGARSFADVFKNVAKSIIADLLRIAIQRTITSALGNVIGSGLSSAFGGGKIATVAKSVGGGIGKGLPKPKLARGGTIRGFAGTDRNILSINGIPQAMVGRGEMLRVEPNNDNGRIAHIVPSPYFNVVVDSRAQRVASPMATQAAMAGSSGAQAALHRRQARRIP